VGDDLWAFVLWGFLILFLALLAALRRLTSAKQQQLSPEEFRRWFQKAYFGVDDAQAHSAEAPAKQGKTHAGKH
jgi:hypothetical protein